MNVIFNITICIIGISILLIHIVNVLFKKNRRTDENRLLLFLCFTTFHFATYLTFVLINMNYKSNELIMAFYTIFYIFNNIEVFLLFLYLLSYVKLSDKTIKILSIINISVFSIYVVLDIINIFTNIFFRADGGNYDRANTMMFSQGYQILMLAIIFFITIFHKKLVIREKIAFGTYCLLPIVGIVVQNKFAGYAIAYATIIISIEILFLFLNVQKNIQLAEEQHKNKETQIKVMMSQIQPHFIYNSLSSISTLITIDPQKAQEGLDSFTEYLRQNLYLLAETKLIPFDDELKHIKTYVSLEKIRFNERINVIYEISTSDFNVPPLSVQPIVENAIKHGILKKIEGGEVRIKSYETLDSYVVEVIDDGIGFDLESVNTDGKEHIGIDNIRHRLSTMCNGKLEISSEKGKGTKVVLTFSK